MNENRTNGDPSERDSYDVVILGGALSGTSAAILLHRKDPSLRICLIERNTTFQRRVGESTVEVSSYFLTRVLGLTEHLNQHHLIKQGLRFWFYNDQSSCPDSCSEIGPTYNVKLSGFQVDRAELDTHLLNGVRKSGVEVLQAAEAKEVFAEGDGFHRITLKEGDTLREVRTRWIIDASGAARFMGRKMGTIERNNRHPIGSVWSRWRRVRSLDSRELRDAYPAFAQRCHGMRQFATNHLIGDGWWSWWIPLKNGDTSIGIVYDERLVSLPEHGSTLDKMLVLLKTHPLSNFLLEEAEPCENDLHWRRNIPYWSNRMIGDGFALVGDASGFLDPFYSPGMDWIAFTAMIATDTILKERRGHLMEDDLKELNRRLVQSYHRWFEAIYENKYTYMGDFELLSIGFRLDLGTYYLGVAIQPYIHGEPALQDPPFSRPKASIPFYLIRFYNRRLSKIGLARRRRGVFGRHNNHHSLKFNSFDFTYRLGFRIFVYALDYFGLELREGWRTWFRQPGFPKRTVPGG